MQDHVYKKIEITGTSTNSSDDAIRNAIARASTARSANMRVEDCQPTIIRE